MGQEFSQRASCLDVGQHDIPLLLGSVFNSIFYFPFLFLSDVLSVTRWFLYYTQGLNRAILSAKPDPGGFVGVEERLFVVN